MVLWDLATSYKNVSVEKYLLRTSLGFQKDTCLSSDGSFNDLDSDPSNVLAGATRVGVRSGEQAF